MKTRNLALMALVPLILIGVYAVPSALAINPSFGWSNSSPAAGGTSTATVGVGVDQDCPSGGFYYGVLTVMQPGGSSSSVPLQGLCGYNLQTTYPTDFGAGASTSQNGVYTTSWVGITSVNGTFDLTSTFVVGGIYVTSSTTASSSTQTSTPLTSTTTETITSTVTGPTVTSTSTITSDSTQTVTSTASGIGTTSTMTQTVTQPQTVTTTVTQTGQATTYTVTQTSTTTEEGTTSTTTNVQTSTSTVAPSGATFGVELVLPTTQSNLTVTISEYGPSGIITSQTQTTSSNVFDMPNAFLFNSFNPIMSGTTSITVSFSGGSMTFPFPTTYTAPSGGIHFSGSGFSGYYWVTYP